MKHKNHPFLERFEKLLKIPAPPGREEAMVEAIRADIEAMGFKCERDAAGNLLVRFEGAVKKAPGQYSFASSGTGGIAHLQMELYKNLSGTFITHIPYRGSGPALNDTVAGQVPIIFDNLPSALAFIKENRLVPIVVAAPERIAALPQVPTFKEVGLEPVNRMAYYGIVGPKGLPKEVVDKINAAVRKSLEDPAVRKRIEDTGAFVVANTPEQFGAQIKAEFETYKRVVEQQKLRLD